MNEKNEAVKNFKEVLVKKIEQEFQEDPIFHKVLSLNFKEELFSDLSSFDSIDFDKHYSTKEATAFLGEDVKEYRLTNTLNREILFPYFRVNRKGVANRYHYDWKAIWRFKMVFLLADGGGMKLVEVEKLLDDPSVGRDNTRQKEVIAMPSKGEKVEVVIVSETLDAIKNEIEDSRRSLQEAIEEVKVATTQRERETISHLKEVLIQDYTHQVKFLEEVEEELKEKLIEKKRIKIWFLIWEFGETFEEISEIIERKTKLLKRKIEYLKNTELDSLTYPRGVRKRKTMNHNSRE